MILIVDDKPENLYSLHSLLKLNAYNVDTASSGEEALKKVLKTEYALIILDVQMPDMDGYEVADAITGLSRTKDIPIIFLSAVHIDMRFIKKGFDSGAVDYITKPFDADLLLLKVKTFIRLHQQTRELKRMSEVLKEEVEKRKQTQKELERSNELLEEKVHDRTKELLKANFELETSNTELQQYASVASHDLQEPLRKIITFSNLISEKFSTDVPGAQPYLKKVVHSTERMRNLINDLLNYSRLSSEFSFIETDLSVVLRETLADLEVFITEKNAKIVAEQLPSAEVIPGQMRQLFQNILSNALKFSKTDVQPVIRIRGERVKDKSFDSAKDDSGNWVRLYISDNGIGFDETYLDKIFTLFQRLHGAEKYEGTGIGLSIVKKIVEKHNGALTASSEEGVGSTFIITIPVRQTDPQLQAIKK